MFTASPRMVTVHDKSCASKAAPAGSAVAGSSATRKATTASTSATDKNTKKKK
ncbi:MAG TPA: hypothetical protein VJV97_10890 [Gemmatimonadaceae bacterium]|nr:hypothetical protein [Gemmatimonadaceae bacterium]